MRILITGVNGTVGTILKEKLKSSGHSVFGLDLNHSPGEVGFAQKMSGEVNDYCRCDISEFRQIERVIKSFGPFDIVYNTAAEFGRWNGEDYYEQLWKTNAIGLKNIIRLQEEFKFKLVHFSSSEVYGDFDGIMTESVMDTMEIKQLNDYAISKWANEMQIRNSAALFKTETVIVRLFNTYGPGEYYHPYRSVNCKFCYHAINGLPVKVYTGHFRSSTYIADAVAAIANIANNFIPGRVYNIGSNEYHDIETLANIIWDYTGADKTLITYGESEILTTKTKTPDNTLSVDELGFKSSISLKEGVHKTIDWMKSNNLKEYTCYQ
jgi:dTDP-glucose 4,6-dehydratase